MVLFDQVDGETIAVDLHGPIDRQGGDLNVLVTHLRSLANHGCINITLNVEELTDVDSVVLGALAQAYIATSRSGATLRLAKVQPALRQLLATTKLDRVIEILE